jgi:hypothetical protein
MKKAVILIILTIMMITAGCSQFSSPKVEIRGYGLSCELNKEDTEKALDFIDQIKAADFSELDPAERIIGGFSHNIIVTEGKNRTVYGFLGNNLYITEESGTRELKIDDEFRENTLYPTMTALFEPYIPLSYPLLNPVREIYVSVSHGEETEDLDMLTVSDLIAPVVISQIAVLYPEAQKYDGRFDDELTVVTYNDGVIEEKIHVFKDYVVIKDRKIDLGSSDFSDSLLKQGDLMPGRYVMVKRTGGYMLDQNGEYAGVLNIKEDWTAELKYFGDTIELMFDPVNQSWGDEYSMDVPYYFHGEVLALPGIGGTIYYMYFPE